ncbi:MAG: hypothetical protein ACKO23_07620, partial [Gemmataceae bacterium]
MHMGWRPRVDFPASYRHFHLVRTHGRVFAAPDHLDREELFSLGTLFTHPGVFSAVTLEEIRERIDSLDGRTTQPEPLGHQDGYQLVRFGEEYLALPGSCDGVDLAVLENRQRARVLSAPSLDQLRSRIEGLSQSDPVEFAGWLPIFEFSGNCGRHPQFAHTQEPPPGYRFTCSSPVPIQETPSRDGWMAKVGKAATSIGRTLAKIGTGIRPLFAMFVGGPRVGLRKRVKVLGAMSSLGANLLRRGCRFSAVARF